MPLHSELLLKWTALLKSMILRLFVPDCSKVEQRDNAKWYGESKKGTDLVNLKRNQVHVKWDLYVCFLSEGSLALSWGDNINRLKEITVYRRVRQNE